MEAKAATEASQGHQVMLPSICLHLCSVHTHQAPGDGQLCFWNLPAMVGSLGPDADWGLDYSFLLIFWVSQETRS